MLARTKPTHISWLGQRRKKLQSEAETLKAQKKLFRKCKEEFQSKSNTVKNAALYVDFKDDKFVAPHESITPDMVADIAARNKEFLGLSFPKLELLRKWERDPEQASRESLNFERRLKELKDKHPNDPLEAVERLLQEMLKARQNKN
jgi:hypothetical protein